MKQVSVFQPDWIKTADDQRPPLNKERLSEDEAARVGDYLEAGATVMHTTARGVDILNNDEKVVPLTIRTDGEYVWTGPVTYYVQTYAVAPDADFLAHVRARDYQMGEVSAAEVEAAAAVSPRRADGLRMVRMNDMVFDSWFRWCEGCFVVLCSASRGARPA